MANDDTGKIGPAGASNQPESGAEEPRILEEHIVAAPQKATRPSLPKTPQETAVPPDSPDPAAPMNKPPSGEGQIADMLAKIKLPERKKAEEKPAQVYDTSLTGDGAKKDSEKESAHAAAIQTARSITESLQPAQTPDVKALHTLRDDLQGVVRDKKISLVRAVALEEEKRHHGTASQEQLEAQAHREKRTRFGLFLVVTLVIVGVLALGAVLFVMQDRSVDTGPLSAQILFSEQSAPLPITTLAPADIRREVAFARNSGTLTLGAILQVIPVIEQTDASGEAALAPVSFGSFLDRIGAQAPEELARSLGDEFFFGIHTVDENAPLFVVPVLSYERAFAAMFEWEATMNKDLSPMFTDVPMQTTGADGVPKARVFEDAVMRNFDVRALKDDDGVIQLYYSFPTRNILIIAESPYSFPEILSRLRADRRL